MIRTQVQLTEEQARRVKRSAAEAGVSMAELIRRAIDAFVAPERISDEEKRRRALSVVGAFRSGLSDVSENHDTYLAEAYAE